MDGLTEEKIYEAFGLDKPTAGNDQAGGAPEVRTDPAAADAGQAAAETVEPEAAGQVGTGEPGEGGAEGTEVTETKPQQSQQERRENAARRRKAEQQAAIDAALAAQKQQFDDQMQTFFAQAGLKNSVTGEVITSMEDFAAWQAQHQEQKLQRDLKAGKLTRETLDQLIGEHPAIKQAQALVQQTQAAEQQRREAEARARADADIAEIRKLDPGIQGVGDLLKMDRADQFSAYVKRGNSFLDAYRLTYFDKIAENAAKTAREQALRSVRSKDHLSGPVAGRGPGAVSVSAQEMAYYRAFLPNASDAEIQAFHNKHTKK